MRLEKTDWLEHGISVLTTEGAVGLKIEPMVASLKVTRGSFYWHFKNIEAFKMELLEFWRLRVNATQIEELGAIPKSNAQIAELVKRVLCQPQELEAGVRAWAGSNKEVEKRVTQIDKMRIEFLQVAFTKLGLEANEAMAHATLLHWAYVGRAVAPHHSEDRLRELEPILSRILTRT